jgi:ADP-dependent NAD(P)H-hydrate dehydratase / NAD(P)H-hydrate epimerase
MPAPIVNVAQMRKWETATWAAKRTPTEVISRVGHLVTAHARQLTRAGDSILILAGKGHNGDDARQVVLNLTDREVTLLNITEAGAGLRDFKSLLSLPPALIIEGLFGIGLRDKLDAGWIRLIDRINRSQIPILSVDVPAGLNADTGLAQGTAIRATCTLTLAAPKSGLLQASAVPYVGRLELAPDIGLIKCPVSSDLQWTLANDFEGFPPPRPVNGHKGTFGHLVIVAGSLGYHGAAVLAARGALRAQPGLVTLRVPDSVYIPIAAQLQSAMVHPWRPNVPLPTSTTAMLFGPGLAAPDLPELLRSELERAWKELPMPVVVDASALNWLPAGRIKSKAARVLTPHPGEAAALLGCEVATILNDRPAAVRELSKRYANAWIVLKGHHTMVGRSTGILYFNSSGNPWLAQGGSGDVLAGYLAGYLAQPQLTNHTSLAIRHAVWQHGATADRLTTDHPTWTVENLADHLGSRRPGAPSPACRLEDQHRRVAL